MNIEKLQLDASRDLFNNFLADLSRHYAKGNYDEAYSYTAHTPMQRLNNTEVEQLKKSRELKTQSIDAVVIESKITNHQYQISKNLIESYNISPYSIEVKSINNSKAIKIPLRY